MQLVRRAIVYHHFHHRIAQYHLLHTSHSGVVVHHSIYIGVQQARYFGQRSHKIVGHCTGIGYLVDRCQLLHKDGANGFLAVGPRRHIAIIGKYHIFHQLHQAFELL